VWVSVCILGLEYLQNLVMTKKGRGVYTQEQRAEAKVVGLTSAGNLALWKNRSDEDSSKKAGKRRVAGRLL